MNILKKHTLILLSTFFGFGIAKAQNDTPTPDLVTDRPDATESPTVVPPGSLQVETGASLQTYDDGVTENTLYNYNTALVRYGIWENLELRLGWNYEELRSKTAQTTTSTNLGFSPLLLGVKVAVVEERGWLPEIGLLGHLYLPFTAKEALRPETTGTDFRFAFSHTLSDKSGLAYNIGAQFFEDVPGAAYIYSISYGYSFTDRLGVYAELYGDLPENFSANHFWDAGVTYLVSPLIQLDATVGQSITEGQDLLLSAGVSFRIDKN